ncbi:hypothetical protein VMCG_07278 [Cytospora schulzeri]|uniref:Uncharacterized protein n=1 Tax=Cytospora schulzeri TaxID=448051 RepID=A0A423WAC2_9PEZI|nr:hypothetical protein VMCG_07278 [Valsa malicola]
MKTPTYEDTTLVISTRTCNITSLGSSLPTPIIPAVVTKTIYQISASSADVPPKSTGTTTGLPTGAIAGITVGSVVGLLSLVLCVLCAFGVRIRRCSMSPMIARPAPSSAAEGRHLHVHKSEPVRDTYYYTHTQRLERLHDYRSRSGVVDANRIAAFPGPTRENMRRSRSLVELEGDLAFRERADSIVGTGRGIVIYRQDTGDEIGGSI